VNGYSRFRAPVASKNALAIAPAAAAKASSPAAGGFLVDALHHHGSDFVALFEVTPPTMSCR